MRTIIRSNQFKSNSISMEKLSTMTNKFFRGFSLVAVLVLLVAGISYASSNPSKAANQDSACACSNCCKAGVCCDAGSCCDQGDCKCESCECDCCKPAASKPVAKKACCSIESLVTAVQKANVSSCSADATCCESACENGDCNSDACPVK